VRPAPRCAMHPRCEREARHGNQAITGPEIIAVAESEEQCADVPCATFVGARQSIGAAPATSARMARMRAPNPASPRARRNCRALVMNLPYSRQSRHPARADRIARERAVARSQQQISKVDAHDQKNHADEPATEAGTGRSGYDLSCKIVRSARQIMPGKASSLWLAPLVRVQFRQGLFARYSGRRRAIVV